MTRTTEHRSFTAPDETREFPNGQAEIVAIGGAEVGRTLAEVRTDGAGCGRAAVVTVPATTSNGPTDLPRTRFARAYLRASSSAERRGASEHRRRLLDGLTSSVVEIGAGSGLNFAHYPSTVTRVAAVEPEPTLRAAAVAAAAEATVPIHVQAGVADALPLDDASVDAAVASLVLCSVPDQQRALAEIHRVLRPAGELRFYEHVIPERHPKRALLQIADRSGLWPLIAGGCHPARDTAAAIDQAGFEIESSETIMFAAAAFEPKIPYILGVARRS